MKKNYQFLVGIDVSKAKLDYCIVSAPGYNSYKFGVIANNEKGVKQLIDFFKKNDSDSQAVLFCLENTGVYSMPICYWLQANNLDYWVVPALEVKKTKGISRGKTDKADSKDIAMYALTHLHQLKLSALPEKNLIELRLLLAEREKLVKSIGTFKMTTENKSFIPKDILKSVLANNKKTTALLQQQLNNLEKLIQKIVDENPVLKQQSKLLQSVPGIGKQTSVNLIAYTHAFTSFKNWRKFACFCGLAPFPYQSGSSIKGKTKVHHLANKKLKALLNLAALSAKKNDPEIKYYFERKVKEGKNKMSVLNAIRCKVISRAFAVIQRGSAFVNLNKFAAA
jgi:transposase